MNFAEREQPKAKAVWDLRLHYLERISHLRSQSRKRERELGEMIVLLLGALTLSVAVNYAQAFGIL